MLNMVVGGDPCLKQGCLCKRWFLRGQKSSFALWVVFSAGSTSGEHGRGDVYTTKWPSAVDEEWFASSRRACILYHLSRRPVTHQINVSTETDAWHWWRQQREVSKLLTLYSFGFGSSLQSHCVVFYYIFTARSAVYAMVVCLCLSQVGVESELIFGMEASFHLSYTVL